MKKRLLFSLVCISCLVASPSLADETGKSALDAWLQSNAGIGLEMSYQSAEEDGDLLTVRGFTASYSTTLETGGDQQSPDQVTLELIWTTPLLEVDAFRSDVTGFSVARMVLSDDTKISARILSSTQDDIAIEGFIEGYEVHQAAWPIYPEIVEDPKHPVSRWLPILEQVLDYRIDESRVDRLGLTVRQGGADAEPGTIRYEVRDLALKKVRDGRIAEYSSGRSTQIISDDGSDDLPTEITMKIAHTRIVDYDLGALLSVFDPPSGASSEYVTAVGSMVMLGYDIDADPVRLTIDRIAYEDIEVRPPETSLLPLFDAAVSGVEIDPVNLGLAVFDAYRSMAIGRFSIDGVNVSFPDPDNPGTIGAATLGQLLILNLDSGGLDEFSISSADFDMGSNGVFSLGKMSIGDIEFAPYGPMKTFIRAAAISDEEPDPLEAAKTFSPLSISAAMKDLFARIPGQGEFGLDGYFLGLKSSVPPVPTDIELSVDGFEIPISALDDEEAEALFAAAGIETLRLSESVRIHWDEKNQDLFVDNLVFDVGGLGRVSARAQLGGIPKSVLENPQRLEAVIATLNLKNMEIQLINEGGVQTALDLVATQQGVGESQLIDDLLGQLDGLLQLIDNEGFANQVSSAARQFFDDPRTLRVSARPQNPVPVIQIIANLEIAPGSIPDLLDLKIDANP